MATPAEIAALTQIANQGEGPTGASPLDDPRFSREERSKLAKESDPSTLAKTLAVIGDAINRAYGGRGGFTDTLMGEAARKSQQALEGFDQERRDAINQYLFGRKEKAAQESQDKEITARKDITEKQIAGRAAEGAAAREARADENQKQRDWQSRENAAKMAWEKKKAAMDRDSKATKQAKPSQYQVGNFGARMLQSEKAFSDLEAQGFRRESLGGNILDKVAGVAGMGTGAFTRENRLKQEQAERNFVNAVLRRESGAAIAESEFESAAMQYFPRVGDTPEVLKQKRENRKQAITSFLAEAGDQVRNEIVPPSSMEWWSSYQKGHVIMVNEKGERYSIPSDKVAAAQQSGFKIAQ